MKIFPLKFLSNYDKCKNLMQIMEDMHTYRVNPNKYNVEVNTANYIKQSTVKEILNKYYKNIKETISK